MTVNGQLNLHGSANINPAHKNMSSTNKQNYRPISVLRPVSKIFERLLCIELSLFMKDKFHLYYAVSGKIIIPIMH